MVGFIDFGSYILGYKETNCYFYTDVAFDLQRNQTCYVSGSFLRYDKFYYGLFNSISSIAIGYYIYHEHQGSPFMNRSIYIYCADRKRVEWNCFYIIDTSTYYCYTESLFTHTPLLLKYPKYYNWHRIPQILTPKFTIWSFYDLDLTSIDVYIKYEKNNRVVMRILNSAVNKDKVVIRRNSGNSNIYEIEAYFDDIIPENTEVEIGISCQDVKGNWLKEGLW